MQAFRDPAEFKRVFTRVFELMNEHPEVGRPLRDAHAPHRFVITDLGLTLHVDAAPEADEKEGRFLTWTWDAVPWEPLVTMRMASATANRYFQGKENLAIALALGRIKIAGPPITLLKLAPITLPIHPVYRRWLEQSGLTHLLA